MRLEIFVCFLMFCQALSIDLQCEFRYATWVTPESSAVVMLADIINATVTTRDAIVTNLGGHNAIFYADNPHDFFVKRLTFSEQTLHYIPKGLEKFFPDLKMLHVHNSKLQSLSQADLKPFSELVYIFVTDNEITTLDSNLFEFNTKVRVIDLSNNKLVKIAADLFEPLGPNFDQIGIQGNPCIPVNGTYTPDNLPALVEILKTNCV